jgi:hypothetical protein
MHSEQTTQYWQSQCRCGAAGDLLRGNLQAAPLDFRDFFSTMCGSTAIEA